MSLHRKLAAAVMKSHITTTEGGDTYCTHCDQPNTDAGIFHTPDCIVTTAYYTTQPDPQTNPIKFGLDIHGVCDKHPTLYAALSQALVSAGHEVHILTGIREELVADELQDLGISYTHFFSIHQHFLDRGDVPISYDEQNRPVIDTDLWNTAKGQYAKTVGLDIHIDDSPHYRDHFDTEQTPFLFQQNDNRTEWR